MRTLGPFLVILIVLIGCPGTVWAWGWLAYAAAASAYDVPNDPAAAPSVLSDLLEPWRPEFRVVGTDSGFNIVFRQRDDVAAVAPPPDPGALGLRVNPNPFRDRALLAITIPLSGLARLSLVDVRGKVVETLWHEPLTVGSYERVLPANLPTGQYFLRLVVNDKQTTVKVVILH